MNLLLDTHVFIWYVLGNAKLSGAIRQLIDDPANLIHISPASIWEIAIKVRLGNLQLHASFDDFMKQGITGSGFQILPIEPWHCSLLTAMPFHHRDPFDRMLAAQALAEQFTIVSADTQFESYGVPRCW